MLVCENCNLIISETYNKVKCENCGTFRHTWCISNRCNSWICDSCDSGLPFQNLSNHNDFLEALHGPSPQFMNNDFYDSQNLNSQVPVSLCRYFDIGSFNQLTGKPHVFSLFHANSRSLNKNFNSIIDFLSLLNHEFSIIGFSETWLSDQISPLLQIDQYTFIESHRDSKRGGGVGLFISNNYTFVKRTDISFFNEAIESIFIEIAMNKNNIIVGVVYRPPQGLTSTFNEYINIILNLISSENKHGYIMGDFNIDLLKNGTSDFINTVFSNNFFPTISKPTRVSGTVASLIDNIFTNNITDITPGILLTNISDHFPVFIQTSVEQSKSDSGYYARNYSDKNTTYFNNLIHNTDWNFICSIEDVNVAYYNFITVFQNIYDECFPYIYISNSKRRKKRHPWITTGILQSIKRKNKLYRKMLKNPNMDNSDKFRTYRNKLTHIIRISKTRYYSDKFNSCSGNSKRTWAIINDVLHNRKSKSSIPDTMKVGNGKTNDPKQITNAFNDFFINVGPTLASDIHSDTNPNHYLRNSNPSTLYMSPANESEVFKVALACLKPDKSAGFDGIKPSILRKVLHYVVHPLTHIINLSLATGTVPDHIKIAKVIPVYKEGDHDVIGNYRPVSVLTGFSKIFERIVHNRIYNFISKHDIMFKSQYGYRPGHSTELALTEALEVLYDAIDNKRISVGVFLDLSKAFDTIDHRILFMKLSHYGIRGTGLDWIRSYLSNRKQFTNCLHTDSDCMNVVCGVPQGSILGPLLFIIYVNDICHVSDNCTIISFADDTNIFFSGLDPVEMRARVCHVLDEFHAWFSANKLSLNVGKTKYVVFNEGRNRNILSDIQMHGSSLKKVCFTTFLGVTIDSGLTWRHHINTISTNISRGVGILSKLKHYLPKHILRSLYFTLIYPHLTYCITVWSGTAAYNIKKLFVLQKRAIRHISSADYNDHTSKLFASLKLLKLPDLVKVHLATFAYRSINGYNPPTCKNLFTVNREIHDYNTRQAGHIHRLFPHSNLGKQSIRYRANTCWNYLLNHHDHIQNDSQSPRSFKSQLSEVYISDY